MKKLVLPVVVATLVICAVASCKKTVKAIFPGAESDLPEVVQTMPAIDSVKIGTTVISVPLHTPYSLPRIIQHFNLDSIVKVNTGNNFGAADITSVKVKSFRLKIVQYGDSANNLANFESASFNFSSNTKSDPIKVATVNFVDAFSLDKVISGDGTPELRPYLDGTELYYDISASLRRHTKKSIKISIIATVTMK